MDHHQNFLFYSVARDAPVISVYTHAELNDLDVETKEVALF